MVDTGDGALTDYDVRAFVLYLMWSGFNPGVNAMCELSLLLVLFLAPIGFSQGTPVFPSPQKPKFDQERLTKNLYVDVLPSNRYLLI